MDTNETPKLTALGKLAVLLFVAGCLYGAWHFFLQKKISGDPASSPSAAPEKKAGGLFGGIGNGAPVEIGIAYGTEKQRWLEWARDEFAKSEAGERIQVNLVPMGSVEGAQAILRGDSRIQVWSPASALYKDVFVQDWQVKNGNPPILREENLALTPMVFVFWEERYQAFLAKYGQVTFKTIGQALAETSGWQEIAGKPQWGLFKFGHTHPNQSNSGLMTLVLMAYDYQGKSRGLELKDILDPSFQSWINGVERGVSGLSNSTGTMMREMVLKGPSAFDALFVYESVVIDYLKNAEGRWGPLRVVYPERNLWNENPYYVLDVPWSTPEQRKAAGEFLDFLLSEPIQRQSLVHGFRPGNPAVPIRFPESPFVLYQRFGLSVDLGNVCEPPKAEVLNNLLAGWQRAQGS
jgi:ABC-type glycerol-3-phosphate transport system substrate-binding protein